MMNYPYTVTCAQGEARFLVKSDAELFARAAGCLYECAPVMSDTEMDGLTPLPYVLYASGYYLLLNIAAFSSEGMMRFSASLFRKYLPFDYISDPEAIRYAPLNMRTIDFLKDLDANPAAPHPYPVIEAYLRHMMAEREPQDTKSEFDCFLGSTPLTIHKRNISRWQDVFHLVLHRLKAAKRYVSHPDACISDDKLSAFVSSWKEAPEDLPAPQAAILVHSPKEWKGIHKIIIDADGCPVIRQTVKLAARYSIPVILLCDDAHEIASGYGQVIHVPRGKNAADWMIVNCCHKGDIVITQDFGLATILLAKGCCPIHQDGWWYAREFQSLHHGASHIRRRHGSHKRSHEDDKSFEQGLEELIRAKFKEH